MDCPMTEKLVNNHGLSEKFIIKFCDRGCSVDCKKLLDEEIAKQRKPKKVK